jgi:hypothetical protein
MPVRRWVAAGAATALVSGGLLAGGTAPADSQSPARAQNAAPSLRAAAFGSPPPVAVLYVATSGSDANSCEGRHFMAWPGA